MRHRRCVIVTVLAVVMAGCAPPRVDSSTDRSFKVSLARVRRSVPVERRAEFDEALATISAHGVTPELVAAGVATTASIAAAAKVALNSKTADEIMADAVRLEAEREAQARVEVEKEIAVLVAEQESAFAAREALRAFEILQARLVPSAGADGRRQWQIRLAARNGTAYAVSHVYLEATVDRPGRPGPWLREEFSFAIRGQLAPGESRTWLLRSDALSSWSAVDIPPDARLAVTVTRLDDPHGQPLLDARGYTEADAARLIALQHQLTMLAVPGAVPP